jgi:dephospho-CoA kinase
MRVGLTGGVGSGKSTVARLLAGHGAVIIDADTVAREVVAPGTPGFAAVVGRFGDGVTRPDGYLDRSALAAIVFNDETARRDLNRIVHPLVGSRTAELAASAPPDAVVVHDIPLLVENGLAAGFDAVVVVEAAPTVRVERLRRRGVGEQDARARMAAQATDEQRRAVADEVIRNDEGLDALAAQVDALWQRLERRATASSAPPT